ncbi:hypothetical protein ACQKMI_17835 [Lysinibacillus sp. NPDC097214]
MKGSIFYFQIIKEEYFAKEQGEKNTDEVYDEVFDHRYNYRLLNKYLLTI